MFFDRLFGNKNPKIKAQSFADMDKDDLRYILNWGWIDPESGTVFGKDGSFMVSFRFRGPDMESSTPEELIFYVAQLNDIIKNLPTGYSLYVESQRCFEDSYDKAKMPSPLLQKFEDERSVYYSSKKHFESHHFFTICYLPPKIVRSKIDSFLIKDARQEEHKEETEIAAKNIMEFGKQVERIVNLLGSCFPSIEPMNGEDMLSYLHSCISNSRFTVGINNDLTISDYICDCNIVTGSKPMLGDRHMRVISIHPNGMKGFPFESNPGILDILDKLNFEYRWVVRFIPLAKKDAQKALDDYYDRYDEQTKSIKQIIGDKLSDVPSDKQNDLAVSNKMDTRAAKQELDNELASFGYFTMTVIVKDVNQSRCEEKANAVLHALQSCKFVGYIEGFNSIDAWYGSLPGQLYANVRRPIINSLNFCHFAPFLAQWPGDRRNQHLGGPVLLYTDTTGNTPFRLSLHEGDNGHTMVVGPSGSGKSVLLNTIEAHFPKYKGAKVFVFDKGMSSRALCLAAGGNFYNLAQEGKGELSFQPLARIDDETEEAWCQEWILSFCEQMRMDVKPQHRTLVWDALESLKTMPVEERTISNFYNFVQSQDIKDALVMLTKTGSYGRLFDNSIDFFGTGNWQCFEMETIMNMPSIVPLTLDYLFHRIEGSINEAAGPSMIVLDECWLFFDNPIFQKKLKDYFKTMRKKNCQLVFATQNLSDIANKPELLNTLMDSCPSRIYLPNVHAGNDNNRELYHMFGLNDSQIRIISQIKPKQDYYFSGGRGNRVFRLALQESELPFVTATYKEDQQEIDRFLSGNNRKDFVKFWLQKYGKDAVWHDLEANYS